MATGPPLHHTASVARLLRHTQLNRRVTDEGNLRVLRDDFLISLLDTVFFDYVGLNRLLNQG